MAEAVVTVVLETIGSLLIEEGKYLFGVPDQLEELRAELKLLQSFLKDAEARKHEEESLRTWVNEAKLLAYEAEDIIEEFVIKVASKRGGGFRQGARRAAGIVGEGIAIQKLGNEIGKIKTQIAHLKNNLETYGINQIIEAQPSSASIEKQRRLRTTYAHTVDEYFVGMEDDVSKIVTWVTEDDKKIHRVISVCGIGGLGKTTIARKVFNHLKVQRSFECLAWVSVTQQCQVIMLLQNILIQILEDRDNVKNMMEDELVRKLYDVLKNKKCFVVLDDIWELDDWNSLLPAFPISEGSSKFLLTTRIGEVANVAQQHSRHEPKLLEEKDGWDLLTKIALNLQEDKGNTLQEQVVLVGRAMLHKCGGLPLAISLLGGLLKNKDPLTEWDTVNKRIVSVLAFSYDDLPSYLRPCFLYMGCFDEDEEIDVTRLYQLWMAEGLIPASKQGREKSLMDAAGDLLDELISRNMVQPQVRNELIDEKFCKLHDLVRELCLRKGKEEQFLEVKSKSNDNEEDGLGLCRQAIFQLKNGIEIASQGTYLRALMIFNNQERIPSPRLNFKRLRSLILDNCEFKNGKLPKEIIDIIHLRYLSLQRSLYNGKLLAFICDLQYIQTLDLRYNDKVQLPNIFHKMKSLRCLYLPYRLQDTNNKKLKFYGLNKLEVLEGLMSKYDEVTHLSELVNIRRLSAEIQSYEDLSIILVQLSSLLKIQRVSIVFKLYSPSPNWKAPDESEIESEIQKWFPDVKKLLLCPSLHKLELRARIGKLPRYGAQFWPDLVSLLLWRTEFVEDPMPFLQELPNLRELTLWTEAYVGKEMYCSSKAFPKLTQLRIINLTNIEKWRVDAGAFPNLSTLIICICDSLKEIVPHGLTHITSLTRLDLRYMPEEFRIKYGSLLSRRRLTDREVFESIADNVQHVREDMLQLRNEHERLRMHHELFVSSYGDYQWRQTAFLQQIGVQLNLSDAFDQLFVGYPTTAPAPPPVYPPTDPMDRDDQGGHQE